MSESLAWQYLTAVLQSHISRGDGPGGSVLAGAFGLGGPAGPAPPQPGEDTGAQYGAGEPGG